MLKPTRGNADKIGMNMRSALKAISTNAEPAAVPLVSEHPDVVAVQLELDALVKRLGETEQRAARARAAGDAPKPTRTPLERARLLVDGGHIPSAEPHAELRAAEEEAVILRAAINEMTERRSAVISQLTYEATKACVPEHVAALRRLDGAFEAMHTAIADLHRIDATLRAAGHQPRSDILPAPIPRAAYQLGDPEHSSSAAYGFRRFLRKAFGDRK